MARWRTHWPLNLKWHKDLQGDFCEMCQLRNGMTNEFGAISMWLHDPIIKEYDNDLENSLWMMSQIIRHINYDNILHR